MLYTVEHKSILTQRPTLASARMDSFVWNPTVGDGGSAG